MIGPRFTAKWLRQQTRPATRLSASKPINLTANNQQNVVDRGFYFGFAVKFAGFQPVMGAGLYPGGPRRCGAAPRGAALLRRVQTAAGQRPEPRPRAVRLLPLQLGDVAELALPGDRGHPRHARPCARPGRARKALVGHSHKLFVWPPWRLRTPDSPGRTCRSGRWWLGGPQCCEPGIVDPPTWRSSQS
jgi:hypothetical protein